MSDVDDVMVEEAAKALLLLTKHARTGRYESQEDAGEIVEGLQSLAWVADRLRWIYERDNRVA